MFDCGFSTGVNAMPVVIHANYADYLLILLMYEKLHIEPYIL